MDAVIRLSWEGKMPRIRCLLIKAALLVYANWAIHAYPTAVLDAEFLVYGQFKLLSDIREQILPLEAKFIEQTEYGPKYQIRSTLTGPNGRSLRVMTIWMIEDATNQTKFVTLVPDKL
jgi:hypothetical protein